MSKITEDRRDHIADENFAFPKERKEPYSGPQNSDQAIS
jgi:hypothetical protein